MATYDYQNKYFTDVTSTCPSGLPRPREREIQRIWWRPTALGCRGWGRADIDDPPATAKPFLLEINLPGMTRPFARAHVGRDGASATKTCAHLLASSRMPNPAWTRRKAGA